MTSASRLYPQLPRAAAAALAAEYGTLRPEELRARAALSHELATFSPTGGSRVSSYELSSMAEAIRDISLSQPGPAFDAELARYLHGQMQISRAEASLEGVRSFLGCVLLPDIVRTRFGSSPVTPSDRFLGGARGIRSVFGRVWWRGELLRDDRPPTEQDPYWLLDRLGEDELTGLLERQSAVASRRVAVALAKAIVSGEKFGVPQMEVARDGLKRYLRLGAVIGFEALDPRELQAACDAIFFKAALKLKKSRGSRSQSGT